MDIVLCFYKDMKRYKFKSLNTENYNLTKLFILLVFMDFFMITTKQHFIRPLSASDSLFILELLNTEGWITYIGDRNINSQEDALSYIQNIRENPNAFYWVIVLKETNTAIGLVTLIKRDYLDIRDIGFALLPIYSGQGHALEATKAILNTLNEDIAAITLAE